MSLTLKPTDPFTCVVDIPLKTGAKRSIIENRQVFSIFKHIIE